MIPAPDAFIICNQREHSVDKIIDELGVRGVDAYYWRRDIPSGEEREPFEPERFNEAKCAVVFLGEAGWGSSHLRLAAEAQRLEKRLIPVLIGNPPENDYDQADGLFRRRFRLDLRELKPDLLDRLADEILGRGTSTEESTGETVAVERAPTPVPEGTGDRAPSRAPQESASPSESAASAPANREIDGLVRAFVDGNETQRADALARIQASRSLDKRALAKRLRWEVSTHFGPEQAAQFASARRDPTLFPSIRSWLLSALILTDAEGAETRDFVLKHVQAETEPDRHVRFWALAGLVQRNVSYLAHAAERCASDPMPEVNALSLAIRTSESPAVHEEFLARLHAERFETTWSVLRVLRVVPIPPLAGEVCALLDGVREEKTLAYDVLYALSLPIMAREAAPTLAKEPGVAGVVERLVRETREANENATRNLSVLLMVFEPGEVDGTLDRLQADELRRDAATEVQRHLGEWRRRMQNVTFEKTYSSFVPDRTTYGPRAKGESLDDSLGVRTHAAHLGQLIAARDTWMPLSIGLFGPWGSGKTYFIDLLEESLTALSGRKDSVFHEQIVQIRFNAWHYLDTNLWASLVCEIFDQLFRKLDEHASEGQVQKLKDELARQSGLAAEANEALKTAEAARVKAEEDLRRATKEREEKESSVRGLLDDLTSLLTTHPVVQGQLSQVATALGLPKLTTSFSELEARAEEVRSLQGRIKAMGLAALSAPGWWRRALLLATAIVAPMGITWLAHHGGPWLQDMLNGATRAIAQVVSAVGAVSAWVAAQVKTGNSMVGKLEAAYDKVKAVRSQRESDEQTTSAQKELAAKRQAEDAARHTLRDVEDKMKAISVELAELAPGRQLIRFLKTRATAEDYQRHLGLVSLVRRDFEQLSKLLASAESERDPTLPRVDRIVLYIDDLDRCRADRVIEVLEAVHLLLAFPLFAVVVAVDPRWLRQSLLDHYPRLLGGDGDPAKQPQHHGRPATPQDYLEKIFQVPFNLQRMDKTGFDTLVSDLFRPDKPRVLESTNSAQSPLQDQAPKVAAGATNAAQPAPTPAVPTSPGSHDKPALSPPAPAKERKATENAPASPADPKRLTVTDKEVTDVQRFQPLFQTPRAVKRMANTYCLIRVGVDEQAWATYLGPGATPGNYRIPMLLLAVSSAFPSLARPWLSWLLESGHKQWLLVPTEIDALSRKHADTTSKADWEELATALSQIQLEDWPAPDSKVLSEWAPRVARYSF